MSDSDGSDEEGFGQRLPPLSKAIRDILKRYPDGQIFKELIQNADDAKAKIVHFYVDYRDYPKDNLLHRKLENYQGPSLISFNDAVFTKKDWEGIQRLQDSVKADDPFKVGQFGIGFNSVYHITDLPIIVSGNKVGFFEPQLKIWGASGKSRKISTLQSSNPNNLLPFNGIGGFDPLSEEYSHTLFRFPLRNKISSLSEKTYTPDMLLELLKILEKEAKYLLLFLRSIEEIEVFVISRSGKRSHIFRVYIEDERKVLRENRNWLSEQLVEKYEKRKRYGINTPLSFTSTFSINVISNRKGREEKHSTKWLVCNLVGSTQSDVINTAEQVCVFPTVGTALELESSFQDRSRIFCFLPLPAEACTALPIHIHGTFSLDDNRRELKWPSGERRDDPSANWNILLSEKVLPECYEMLLKKALEILRNDPITFYQAIPRVDSIKRTKWEGLLKPLYYSVFLQMKCFCTLSNEWVSFHEATFIPKDLGEDIPNVVYKIMQGNYNLVRLPSEVHKAMKHIDIEKNMNKLSPRLVRSHLKRTVYSNLAYSDKLNLLCYCLSDNAYRELDGLQLIPLANGDFESFKFRYHENLYVCTNECSISVLPVGHELLIALSEKEGLQQKLQDVASSKETQLRLLKAEQVAEILKKSYPVNILRYYDEVSVEKLGYPKKWFEIFWNWVKNKDLDLFRNLFLVPITSGSTFKVRKLVRSDTIFIERNQDYLPEIITILKKFNVICILQKDVPYLWHRNIYQHFHRYSCSGVLNAIRQASHNDPTSNKYASVTSAEAESFQDFIKSAPDVFESEISCLPIFQCVSQNSKPIAVSEGTILLEPRHFINSEYFPSNFTLLSSSKNKKSLVNMCRNVKTPQSLAVFLQYYVFPLITKKTFTPWENVSPLMEQVFKVFDIIQTQNNSFPYVVQSIPFLYTETVHVYKCPENLFDPSNNDLQNLYKDEDVFPLHPFNTEQYLVHLRKCGLKTIVTAQNIYDILYSVSGPAGQINVTGVAFHRALYVFQFLENNTNLLNEYVQIGYYSVTLSNAIRSLSEDRSIFPVQAHPSSDYPEVLPWRGSNYTCHLTSMNDSVMPFNSVNSSIQNIMGSEMFFIKCPLPLCSMLKPESPIDEVVSHLILLTNYKDCLSSTKVTEISLQVYKYLLSHFRELQINKEILYLTDTKWVWVEENEEFLTPTQVAFFEHDTFHQKLVPYIYVLPRYKEFSKLFTHFGAQQKVTDNSLVSILSTIKTDDHTSDSIKWMFVINILNWVTEDNKKHASDKVNSDILLVPIETSNSSVLLKNAKDVVYTDIKYIKKFSQQKDKSRQFIHRKVEHLSKYLGIKAMSRELNISEDAFEDVGPNESLQTRLQNILGDYNDGLTIVKELLQNADDAEATEVNICYDTRTHTQDPDELFFPEMTRAHGPALIVHNNSTFTDPDFKNIQKLAGATKRDQPLKIGKFGLGFCSVYHITDIPSFVSRKSLFIFDPALMYLKEEVEDTRKPGKKVNFIEDIIQYSEQMSPYKDLFDFNTNQSFDGTIFRLPFRETRSSRCIGKKCYDSQDVDKLYDQIEESGPELLLFLSHLTKITLNTINSSGQQSILEIRKELVQKLSCETRIIKLSVLKTRTSHSNISYWLVSDHKSAGKISSVACSLKKEGCHYLPQTISGEVFCFLPLHCKLGLPVHISANFAVMKDRKGIHRSDSHINKTDEVIFNEELMHHSIPQSYFKLLLALRDMYKNDEISSYNFFTFWPLEENLATKNPWEIFIPCLYDLISHEAICYSDFASQWLTPQQSKSLSTNILHESCHANILDIIKKFKKPVIDLPVKYKRHISIVIFSENDFLTLFFENIRKLTIDVRNNILIGLIKTYTREPSSDRRDWILNNACIPCTPDGKTIRKCSEIIDPKSLIAELYEPSEGMYPIEDLQNDPFHSTLMGLGMISRNLPMHMIIERAKTVEKLYRSDRAKALQRTQTLLDCMKSLITYDELPHGIEGIKNIRFLPVLQRPQHYPKNLAWAGDTKTLLCSNELLMETDYSFKTRLLIGSQKVIVSQLDPSKGGCGIIPERVASALELNKKPNIDDVLNHLILVSKSYSASNKQDNSKSMKSTCDKIYSYLNEILRHKKGDQKIVKCFRNIDHKLLWNGDEFIHPRDVATSWKLNGPYIYQIPYSIRNLHDLLEHLQIPDKLDNHFLIEVLLRIKKDYNDRPITKACSKIVQSIAEELAEKIPEDEDRDDDIFTKCLLYDEHMHMRYISDLSFNDAPWCKLEEEFSFVHHDFSRPTLEKLGVKFVRSRALDNYTLESYFAGVPFGQNEELTQRIRNILDTYTHDETLLKELLQNADDAKAKKLYFILDERTHGTQRLPSSEWKDLQGPSLLVWNDQSFTEDDLKGIQKLGLGSKRSKAESIGQYGIGFNVVYHITDCPSLFTNGNTLCVFDPHCRYVPGANPQKPGRRYYVTEQFWKRTGMSDLKSCFLYDKIENCPQEIQNTGSLFRFPLRSSPELVSKSELTDETSIPINAKELKAQLMDWMPKLKEGLLFLKHVVEIAFCFISDCEFKIMNKYQAVLDDNGTSERSKLYEMAKDFRNGCNKPFIVHYPLQLIEEMPIKKVETWFIQQGVGDLCNTSQHWEYLSHIYPLHGLAAQIQGQQFTPKIFCFLPLPLVSNLPVHVNANFILDSSSRSSLWTSRDTNRADDKKKWNDRLIEALGSSYAQFLVACQSLFFNTALYKKDTRKDLLNDIKRYYDLFPKWIEVYPIPEGEMLELAKNVFTKLHSQKCDILIVVSKNTDQKNTAPSIKTESPLLVNWDVVQHDDPSKQAYFLNLSKVEKEIPRVLKAIGMKLTAASLDIKKHFDNVSIKIPEATEEEVFEYYSQFYHQVSINGRFPCQIQKSKFGEVKLFKTFIKYIASCRKDVHILSESHTEFEASKSVATFPKSPHNIPLMLTADGYIIHYDEKNPVIRSKFSRLFPNKADCFLHQNLLDLELSETYFLRPNKLNMEFVLEILDKNLSNVLKGSRMVSTAKSHISVDELLKPLWRCLHDDPVFYLHITDIISNWALILSKENDLYLYSNPHHYLMPIARPKPLNTSGSNEETELRQHHEILKLLEQLHMPVAENSVVPKAWKYCPAFTDPPSVLRNLYFLHQKQPLLISKTRLSILLLFSYFKKIHFQNDKESLTRIKSLPLFRSVDGRYCSISGEVYLLPLNICHSGVNKIFQCLDQVFLAHDGEWTNLATADTLEINFMESLQFYSLCIIPHFSKLTESERLVQLEHIRDHLFDDAESFSQRDSHEMQMSAVTFINMLKQAPMFDIDGVLSPICKFSDHTHPLFKLFPSHYAFLPEICRNDKWQDFFKKLGLQTIPKTDEFLGFCEQISEGKTSGKVDFFKVSDTLLNCLFQTQDWYDNHEFLRDVSKIPFVVPISSKLHESWIYPPSDANVHYIQNRRKRTALVRLKDCATISCAKLVWTVCPVVKVPHINYLLFLTYIERDKREKDFYSHLGICYKPTESQVLKNITNISQSRFSNFKLFEQYASDCISKDKEGTHSLITIVKENLDYIFKYFQHASSELRDLACIPVNSEYCGDDSKPVLVKTLQALACTTSDIQPELHPFLCAVPGDLHTLMVHFSSNNLKINYQVKVENIQYALDLIRQHVVTPLDPNSVKTVKTLIKLLYNRLFVQKDAMQENSPLYLPNHKNELMESTRLIYDDKGYHKNILYTFHDVGSEREFSILSLLCETSEIRQQYGFSMKMFVSTLPSSHSPMPFSVYIKSQLKPECREQDDSQLTIKLKRAFQLEKFADIVCKIMKQKNFDNVNDWDGFSKYLQNCLNSLKMVTLSKLKVYMVFNRLGNSCIIGEASMDFLFEKNDHGFILYIDDKARVDSYNMFNSFSKYFIDQVIKISGISIASTTELVTVFQNLLKVESQKDLKDFLSTHELFEFQPDRKFDYILNPVLGEPIPEDWHHRLHADLLNNFRPQELIGYEEEENYFIFARIEHRANQVAKMGDNNDEMDMYVIRIKEVPNDGYVEEEHIKTVPVIELYKILRLKEHEKENECKELKLYDPDSDSVLYWEATKDQNLKDIYIKICEELKRIQKISDEDLKRKCLKAMFLKWHPDKNSHPLATKAFQFLQRQIDHMKQGLDLEDPETMEEFNPQSHHSYHNEWFAQWENLSKQRARSYQREQRTFQSHAHESEDWFGFSSGASGISVSPDMQKADVWLRQASHDMTAMEVMFNESKLKPELSANVCFLAHQVAEKSLKAAMYAKNGLHPDSLKSHDLIYHANALADCDSDAAELGVNAHILHDQDYYLKTRYPNRFGAVHRVPAENISFAQADEAVQAAKIIYVIVNKIW